MAHISTPPGLPGIVSLFAFRPETAKPLTELAETLLRGPSSLSRGERELIASYVSTLNNCKFCATSHSAIAKHELAGNQALVESVMKNFRTAQISEKMKALLTIAAKVQKEALSVKSEDIEAAKKQGATEVEIHDTVLIAAAFCMYNRYVDGLASFTPTDPALYDQMGQQISRSGYSTSSSK